MKTKTILITATAAVLGSGAFWFAPRDLSAQTNAPATGQKISYYTCPMHPSVKSDIPGTCHICGMDLVPVYATNGAPASATNNAAAEGSKPKPYPFDVCLVDGMQLGSMGAPYVFVYQKQEIKFCCANCKPEFLENPDQYMKKIQEAEAAAQK